MDSHDYIQFWDLALFIDAYGFQDKGWAHSALWHSHYQHSQESNFNQKIHSFSSLKLYPSLYGQGGFVNPGGSRIMAVFQMVIYFTHHPCVNR